ncbi:MAG TPA: protein kinase [Polyangiaceae bacterium]
MVGTPVVVAERFEVERLANTGGMGHVYRARDRLSGDAVALKVLGAAGEGQPVDRFVREVAVLAELRHPGIVRYVAHGTTASGEPYLAMEWLEGEDLADRLARAGLTIDESVRLTTRVADALAFAHARGIVHRDVKPSNIFLPGGDVDRATLLDFGIARRQFTTRAQTRTGTTLGTPGYMAPEQARGDRFVDPRADLFSMGCVLFECLTGRPPFLGEHVMAVLAKILLEEAPSVCDLRPDVPEALDALVRRLLAKDPDARPCGALDVAGELRALGSTGGESVRLRSRPPPALTTTEQRLVCVVLAVPAAPADEVASSGDPSLERTLAAVGGASLDGLRPVVESRGARLEHLADGSLLVTTSGIGTATDQAVQAARCALALQDCMPDALIALATGRRAVQGRLTVGEVIERAATMLRKRAIERATPAVRVDEASAGLLGERFDVHREGSELILVRERTQYEPARTLLGKPTPCVGRDRELAVLAATYAEVAGDHVSRAVLVTGAPGMGKSRVRYEFLRRLEQGDDPPLVWFAGGDPSSAGSPFGLIVQALRRSMGLYDAETIESRRAKLVAAVRRRVDAAEAGRVAEFLAEMVGLPFPESEASVQLRAARQDAMLMGDQMRRAWEDHLVAECAGRPMLLLLEDLQWGDLPSVELVDGVLRRHQELPLMVLAFARPEVNELFPRLWSDRGLHELALPELTRRASERLVQHVLGDRVGRDTLEGILARASGNAFYLEELIRAVAERGDGAMPETVLAMVEARLERLDPQARLVLRAASVFGTVFWRGAVAALVGRDLKASLDDWLAILVDRELLVRRSGSRFAGEEEYQFRHALVRDAAYSMLTDADRSLGHRLAAQWLERAGETDAVTLAEHFERGGTAERAAASYRNAAAQALEGNDLSAAIARARRGLACGAEGEIRASLRLVEAEAHRWRGENAEARGCALEAVKALPFGGVDWMRAAEELVIVSSRLGDVEAVLAVVGDLEKLGARDEEPRLAQVSAVAQASLQLVNLGRYDRADSLLEWIARRAATLVAEDLLAAARFARARAHRLMATGDVATYRRVKVESAQYAERAGDLRSWVEHRAGVAYGYMLLGSFEEAEAAFRSCLVEADRLGLFIVTAMMKNNLGLILARLGKLAEGRAVENESLQAYEKQGDLRMASSCRSYLATMHLLEGDLEAAEREGRAAVAMCEKIPPSLAEALGTLASVLLAKGAKPEALETAGRAHALLEELGSVDEGEIAIRLVYAEALDASGRRDEARRILARAREQVLDRASKISEQEWRDAFLLRVPENARTLALAASWGDRGASGVSGASGAA